MRILHLLSQHPEATGSGISLQNIINQAALRGHDNFLVAGVSEKSMPVAGLTDDKCCFVQFGRPPLDFLIPGMSDVMPYPSSRFRDLKRREIDSYEQSFGDAVLEAADRFRPELVHSHHLWLLTAAVRRVLPSIPLVTSCHSTDLRQLLLCPHLRERVVPECRRVDRVLALGEEQRARIVELYGIAQEKIDIVGGGFDLSRFLFSKKHGSGPVRILYAGKLSLAKGVDWLLLTMASLGDSDVHLHLAGSGSGEEEHLCLELAARLGSRVTVHGRMEQVELAELMRCCHIFVLPSFYEGLPLVLLEALASGCRLVATALPGTRELLHGVPPALARLVELPPMRQVDRPDEGELPKLVERLAAAIEGMVREVRSEASPSATLCRELAEPFGWPAVFARIEQGYARALTG